MDSISLTDTLLSLCLLFLVIGVFLLTWLISVLRALLLIRSDLVNPYDGIAQQCVSISETTASTALAIRDLRDQLSTDSDEMVFQNKRALREIDSLGEKVVSRLDKISAGVDTLPVDIDASIGNVISQLTDMENALTGRDIEDPDNPGAYE